MYYNVGCNPFILAILIAESIGFLLKEIVFSIVDDKAIAKAVKKVKVIEDEHTNNF